MLIIGEIRSFAFGAKSPGFGELCKQGWIPCDGRSLSVSNYGDLFNVIEYTWGSEKPGTSFCVPNLFGSFLRGGTLWQNATLDPQADLRLSPRPELPNKGMSGKNVGSFQDCAFQSHSHIGKGKIEGGVAYHNRTAYTACAGGPSNSEIDINPNGGIETRPKNHYVMYMIYSAKALNHEELNNMLSQI